MQSANSNRLVRDVGDTSRWVAIYRALESARPDALFRDPFAESLAGQRGQEIVQRLPRGRASADVFAVRTRAIDDLLLDVLRAGSVDTVVNLAAGMDTRPFRLALPRGLRWIDLDLPQVLSHKASVLADSATDTRYETRAIDLADVKVRREVFAAINAEATQVLVLSEGFLTYLSPDDVRALADDLHAVPAFRWWLLEFVSPVVMMMLRASWNPMLAEGEARLQFGLARPTPFFEQHGWRTKILRSYVEEARRLGRQPWHGRLLAPLARYGPPVMRRLVAALGGYLLLERAP